MPACVWLSALSAWTHWVKLPISRHNWARRLANEPASRQLSLSRLQTLFKGLHFKVQPLGKMAAEVGEVLLDQRHLRQPALDIDAEQFVHMSAFDVEPCRVKIDHIGNASDGGIFGMNLTVAALKDPFQHAAVFTITRP